jgi:hypothetical protein
MGRYAREPENATKSCKVRLGWEGWELCNFQHGAAEALQRCSRQHIHQHSNMRRCPGDAAALLAQAAGAVTGCCNFAAAYISLQRHSWLQQRQLQIVVQCSVAGSAPAEQSSLQQSVRLPSATHGSRRLPSAGA